MKGIVFSEFIEMVENKFSIEIADQIIEDSVLASGGAYTSVGTYDHQEMLSLLTKLSEISGIEKNELLQAFGYYLSGQFAKLYPTFFESAENSFDFLMSIENHVHVEVRKLYNDAELPNFDATCPDPNTLQLFYKSKRPFAYLAYGLIEGSIDYFQERATIDFEDCSSGQGNAALFTIKRLTT